MREGLRVRTVDERGIVVGRAAEERAVDVTFDGQRVWSFWVGRDTESDGLRGLLAPWPRPLTRYLDGRTRVALRDPATGEVHFDEEVVFGTSPERVRVANRLGHQLGVDKSGRLVPTFENRERHDIVGLVDATLEVLEVLRGAGVQPFVGYGTLLGAVREGAVLGHDSDADIAYVSDSVTPVDVVRESFRLQRVVNRLGYPTVRYSGAAFKVRVAEADGFTRGLDVFAGFFDGDRLYLMGEVGTRFEREWLYPLGTATLEGAAVPVPARPEKLLEAMYGPGWRVPDPAFQFGTPESTRRLLNDWFRGLRPDFNLWQRRYAIRKHATPRRGPSAVARAARAAATARDATVLDVGAGKGADALWLARKGVPVIAYDYVPHALDSATAVAFDEDLPLEVRNLNLTDLRSVLGEGARLAWSAGPRVVVAQHLLDATTPAGRQGFARFCNLALRDGGVLHTQFTIAEELEEEPVEGEGIRWVTAEEVVELLEDAGAGRISVTRHTRRSRPEVVRLVAEWGP